MTLGDSKVPARAAHVPELDGLRGVAVLMVMAFHARLARGGATGVDVFFVLSGWLITGLLLVELERRSAIAWGAFMARRARRLLPALAFAIAVWVALAPGLWRDGLIALLQLTNVLAIFRPANNFFAQTWSLSQEWQFYLFWPFVVAWLAKGGRRRMAVSLLALWVVLTLSRGALLVAGETSWSYNSPLHWSGLALGAAIAASKPEATPRWIGWAGLVAVLCTLFSEPDALAWSIPISELGTAAIILQPPCPLAWRPLKGLGTISYGVYLWHGPLLGFLAAMAVPFSGPAIFVLAPLAAALSYRYVERPFLRSNPANSPPSPPMTRLRWLG